MRIADPEVIFYKDRFHLFHSRKHLQAGDNNCSLTPQDPTASPHLGNCVEWRTSTDGKVWQRMGVLDAPGMSETMSARVYPAVGASGGDTLVVMTDGGGMVAFTTNATGLAAGTNARALGTFSKGIAVNGYSGLNGSFVNVALRVLPIDAAKPTHVALGWRPPLPRGEGCHGGMTFAVFPFK